MLFRALLLALLSTSVTADTIRFAAGNSMPPYAIANSSKGIALERVNAALQNQGLELELVFGSNIENLRAFHSRGVDAILIATQASQNVFISRLPVMTLQNVGISLNALPINTIEDLQHYRLGAFSPASQLLPAPYASTVQLSPAYHEYPKQMEQVRSLFLGQNQVLVMERSIFRYFFSQLREQDPSNPKYRKQPHYYAIFPASQYYAGFHNQQLRDQFDNGLQSVVDSGEYQQVRARYERLMNEYLLRE